MDINPHPYLHGSRRTFLGGPEDCARSGTTSFIKTYLASLTTTKYFVFVGYRREDGVGGPVVG